MSQKRTIESFFPPQQQVKKVRTCDESDYLDEQKGKLEQSQLERDELQSSSHPTYPFSINNLPSNLLETLNFTPASEPRVINHHPNLDLLYYSPYIPKLIRHELFQFFREELPFYKVKYTIKRGSVETSINTPRYTTVFGVDDTSTFVPTSDNEGEDHAPLNNPRTSDLVLVESKTRAGISDDKYSCQPRPLPACLLKLKQLTEAATGRAFNFCLVNYYSSGADSISYHSDDERFLGVEPAIASFSLGAKRDFCLKPKPTSDPNQASLSPSKPIKFPLESGDMILMRGKTQSHWLHSIPKRKGSESEKGRINITFRKALVKGGTENYYRYNVGDGPAFKWNKDAGEMVELAP